ncbi:unnamed protein product [Heterobilharzia americana]|nr:unnamed protein product [Heterobilharzia americana]
MRYSDDSIYEGFFSEDQRYGPGILLTNATKSTPLQIDVGYWKNDRLIRLRKPVLTTKKQNNEFQFIKQFPQYDFYKLVNLELMFKHFQYQKSMKKIDQLLNNEQVYKYNEKFVQNSNEFISNSYSENSSTNLLIQMIENILKQSNLSASFQVWNKQSPLFEKFIADQCFQQLIYCMPTFIDLSAFGLADLQNILQIIKPSSQNVSLNLDESNGLLNSVYKETYDAEEESKMTVLKQG